MSDAYNYFRANPDFDLGPLLDSNGVKYRVWAYGRQAVDVHIETDGKHRTLTLMPGLEGYFSVLDPAGKAGDLYKYSVDGSDPIPDFTSHYQPQGVFGPSQVVDAAAFRWQAEWKRPAWDGQVIYEVHVGTFTPEGTFGSAIQRLDHLRELGVTAIEIMPVAQSAGDRNWGYDGVMFAAPYHVYGSPDDFRALIDACHARGLAVILDIVFNHLGQEGNFSLQFSSHFFHTDRDTPWGKNFNLCGPHSAPVRSYLLQVIRYWLDEFRIDGFRMDATHTIHDDSKVHLLAEVAEIVHDRGGFIIAEDDRNSRLFFEPKEKHGWNFDAAWSDDFHHLIRVSQTGERNYFFSMVSGTADELAQVLEQGWLYVGQVSPFHKVSRGEPCADFPPQRFVWCISNHDQVGNRTEGERLHDEIEAAGYRALSLLLCLSPYTPLIFMGQEWACSTPFHFFTDMPHELGLKIDEGRKRDFLHTGLVKNAAELETLPSPQDLQCFTASKLNWNDLGKAPHDETLALYRAGLHLRAELFGRRNPPRGTWHIEERPHGVGIHYDLNGRKVAVQIRFKGDEPIDLKGKIILSSNDPAFGGKNPNAATTEVLVIES